MKYLPLTCCIIFSTFSFNAYGMEPEESEGQIASHKNHSTNKVREDALQTLSNLQEGAILYQANIKKLQETEQQLYLSRGYGILSENSRKEQNIPSLEELHRDILKTLETIERMLRNTRKMCAYEEFIKMPQQSQAEQINLLDSFINAHPTEFLSSKKSMKEIDSAIPLANENTLLIKAIG